ncbi:MAG: SprT family zinc-dependent metalloprotease [Candidatus Accumulibacter sp.]|uniref:M48 family metallopeptidase n=1 Tax=Accumulibacter sp. TaxID=2053492 RepID=UPI002879022A|nr:SprT family zinc-dependent metalloprotease [Accumulibacter sp.]MDS4014072.1 SprT family zinc-dependent metalloprotease [Accumulibacter sp.]
MRPPLERSAQRGAAVASQDVQRTIVIGGQTIGYSLRRSTRRSIGLVVDRHGLRVSAPLWTSPGDIEQALLRHADWIARKLGEWQPPTAALLSIGDGQRVPLLGDWLTLRLASGANRAVWAAEGTAPTLTLFLRRPEDAPRVLEKALRERARALFAARIAHHVPRLGVRPPALSLSSARTRWGSCSRRGAVRLNWRLVHFPIAVIDYVVVHELAHLLEMNHGPRFWSLVAQHCPDFRALRARLQQLAAGCPRW